MDQTQLRRILYDHIYTRRSPEPEYTDLSPEALQDLRNFYMKYREQVSGTGELLHGVWVPESSDKEIHVKA
jgi:hypothetical protein